MSQTVPNVAGSQGQWQTIELRNLEFKKKTWQRQTWQNDGFTAYSELNQERIRRQESEINKDKFLKEFSLV